MGGFSGFDGEGFGDGVLGGVFEGLGEEGVGDGVGSRGTACAGILLFDTGCPFGAPP